MKQTKPLENWRRKDNISPTLTPRTFVRAARFTNALIAAVVVVQVCVMAAYFRATSAILLGVILLLFLSLAIWTTAAVLGGAILIPRWLRQTRRPHLARIRPSREGSGIRDEWLDSPIRP